jgi:MFS family permease
MDVHPTGARIDQESSWRQFISGVRQAQRQLELGGLILVSLVFSVFAISYIPMLPAFVEQVLKQGAAAYGWLTAAFGAGAVVGAIIIANRQRPGWRGKWLFLANVLFPPMLVVFIFNTWMPLSFVLEFFMGAAFMIEYTMINTLLQTSVEDHMRGRIMALYTITFLGFSPFGNLALGALSARYGLGPSVAVFAAISLVLSLILFRRIPQMRRLP